MLEHVKRHAQEGVFRYELRCASGKVCDGSKRQCGSERSGPIITVSTEYRSMSTHEPLETRKKHNEHLFTPSHFTLAARLFATSEGSLSRFYGGFFRTDVPSSQYNHRYPFLLPPFQMCKHRDEHIKWPLSIDIHQTLSCDISVTNQVINSGSIVIGMQNVQNIS
jgi:hypothetical protein